MGENTKKMKQSRYKRRWTQKREQEPRMNCMKTEKVLNFTFRYICGAGSYTCLTSIVFVGNFVSCGRELSEIRMQETRGADFVSIS